MASRAYELIKESLKCFIQDDGMRISAALAYYCSFSIAPLLIIAITIAGAIFGEKAAQGALEYELRQNFGPHAAAMIQEMLANASKPSDNVLASTCGLLLLLVGATGVFAQIQAALNTIWQAEEREIRGISGFLRHRLLSFSMVLACGFLLLVSMLLTTSLQLLGDFIQKHWGIPLTPLIAGSGILSFVVATFLFAALFKILPDTRILWKDVWLGSFFTAILFTMGKFILSTYLGRAAIASSYGSAGSFVVMLMWLYYSSAILLFGAEVTEKVARRS